MLKELAEMRGCVKGAGLESVAPHATIGHNGVAMPKALAGMRGCAKGAGLESVTPRATIGHIGEAKRKALAKMRGRAKDPASKAGYCIQQFATAEWPCSRTR